MFKKLGLVFTLRDLRAAYKEEGGKGPIYLSRKFRGVCIVAACSILAGFFGMDITDLQAQGLADNVEAIITAATGIYGFTMMLVSFFKKGNGK
jgi:hypothetical protein